MKGIILVDDYPECCEECEFFDTALDDSTICTMKGNREIEDYKPDWCPIKEFPLKLSPDKPGYKSQYSKGWDAALEEIGYYASDERYDYHPRNDRRIPKENDLYELDLA